MAALSNERVRDVAAPVVTEAGYDLEDVAVSTAGRRSVVRIVVDRDGGVDLDAVAEVSRAISARLDEVDPGGSTPYVLEVSSPGVDRPLTEPRHWRRNVGRLVRAGEVEGRIREVSDDGVAIEVKGAVETVSFTDLGPGTIVVEFS
ncbi:MAG TPA: ribosome maturation factor RimP [Mycobacteriales bacterium]|nr:ribosome maturation factor RimP [Mycobacteriales bacterium]